MGPLDRVALPPCPPALASDDNITRNARATPIAITRIFTFIQRLLRACHGPMHDWISRFGHSAAGQYTPCGICNECGNRRPSVSSWNRAHTILPSHGGRSPLDPFLTCPLSCLSLLSGYLPVGPVAQVARARP